MYAKSFEDLRLLPEPNTIEGLMEFEQLLKTIKLRNAGVVPKLGAVVAEVSNVLKWARATTFLYPKINLCEVSLMVRLGAEHQSKEKPIQ